MRVHPVGLLAIAISAAAAASPASDKLVDEARAAVGRGDFVGAARKFHAAYVADPRPELICNVGVAYSKAHDLPRAQRFLAECVGRGATLDAGFMGAVRDAIATIDAELRAGQYAPVNVVVVPEGATIDVSDFDADERLVGSQLIWLPYGAHVLTAHAEGYHERRQALTISENRNVLVELELERLPPANNGARPIVVVQPSRAPVYAGIAVTGAALVATVATYAITASKIDEIDVHAPTSAAYDAGVHTADHWRDAFIASAAVTVAAGAVTAYLWHRTSTRAELVVTPQPGGAAAMLAGRF